MEGSNEGTLFGGGAAGNLKFLENEPEGFLVVLGSAGVLGAVAESVVRRDGRAGSGNSLEDSTIGGDEEPTNGEGCVEERCPGDPTTWILVLHQLYSNGFSNLRKHSPCQA